MTRACRRQVEPPDAGAAVVRVREVLDHRVGTFLGVAGLAQVRLHAPVGCRDRDRQLRPTDVDREERPVVGREETFPH